MKIGALLLAIVIACCGASAYADTLNLTTLPSHTAGGYYVGGVGGNVDGGPGMFFYCDDFTSTTRVPSSFDVNVSTIPSLTYAKWGHDSAALFKYQEAAWLTSQVGENSTQVEEIQFAIWNIFYPAAPNLSGQEQWIARAQAINPANYDFSSVSIYTPSNSRNQEFISGSVAPVPEPATVILLGVGLIGLWGVRRKIRK